MALLRSWNVQFIAIQPFMPKWSLNKINKIWIWHTETTNETRPPISDTDYNSWLRSDDTYILLLFNLWSYLKLPAIFVYIITEQVPWPMHFS